MRTASAVGADTAIRIGIPIAAAFCISSTESAVGVRLG
jgi:hypothetical protein